jgi:hypothetical protein
MLEKVHEVMGIILLQGPNPDRLAISCINRVIVSLAHFGFTDS